MPEIEVHRVDKPIPVINATLLTANSISGTDLIGLWPNGRSVMVVSTATGYPTAVGTVVSEKASDARCTQMFYTANATVTYIRAWDNINGVWLPWTTSFPAATGFHAYAAVDQLDIPAITHTPINYATEQYDHGSNFSASTFTAPLTGWYVFSGGYQLTPGVDGRIGRVYSWHNDVATRVMGAAVAVGTSHIFTYGTIESYMTAGSTMRLSCFHNLGVGTSDIIGSSSITWFSGHLLRAG